MSARIEAQIEALVVSPGHNYWFHSPDPSVGVGPHPTSYPDRVELVAEHGIVGDRFYGKASRLASDRRASWPPRPWRRSRTSSAWPAARSTRG